MANKGLSEEDGLNPVRLAIRERLMFGHCERASVAQELGISTRTLTRRLGKAGYDFCSLRDEIRRQLAVRYLAMSHLSLREVTTNLGLAEVTSLCRLTRRWFGMTPLGLRRATLAGWRSNAAPRTPSAIERRRTFS